MSTKARYQTYFHREYNPGDEDNVFASMSEPPQVLTDHAIYCRLRRIFKKKKDGTFVLDDRWNKAWLDIHGGGRDSLYSMFEKCAYKPDWF